MVEDAEYVFWGYAGGLQKVDPLHLDIESVLCDPEAFSSQKNLTRPVLRFALAHPQR